MSPLADKTALVTGASRGIGRAAAAALADRGALVAVHYGQSKDHALSLVAEIESAGGRAFAVGGDFSSLGGVRRLFDSLDAELSARTGSTRLDIIVNNAGVAPYVSFAETDEAAFDHVFNVNVKALFFATQHALKRIPDGGRIINISSVVARKHFDGITAYSATKGAVDTLTIHLAQELGPRGITVNAVAPGAIETDMGSWMRDPAAEPVIHQMQALKRKGQPEDIARAVAFLASPDAAWITGQIIDTSGGTKL